MGAVGPPGPQGLLGPTGLVVSLFGDVISSERSLNYLNSINTSCNMLLGATRKAWNSWPVRSRRIAWPSWKSRYSWDEG